MDLRLKDYARKEGREWYEILRNHVKEKPEKKVIRIFLRPSSGRISIYHLRSTDAKPDTFTLIAEFDRTLRGIDCDISFDYWNELALTDPPWIFPARIDFGLANYLSITPSFVLLDYTPKDDKEYFRFSIPEPVTIHLSSIWVEKKDPAPLTETSVLKIVTDYGIDKLVNLFGAMVEQGWIEKGSEQLVPKRFITSTLNEAVDPGTPPFNWLDGIVSLRRLLSRDILNINNKLAIDHFLNKGKDLNLNSLNSGTNATDKPKEAQVDLLCGTHPVSYTHLTLPTKRIV